MLQTEKIKTKKPKKHRCLIWISRCDRDLLLTSWVHVLFACCPDLLENCCTNYNSPSCNRNQSDKQQSSLKNRNIIKFISIDRRHSNGSRKQFVWPHYGQSFITAQKQAAIEWKTKLHRLAWPLQLYSKSPSPWRTHTHIHMGRCCAFSNIAFLAIALINFSATRCQGICRFNNQAAKCTAQKCFKKCGAHCK